MVKIYVHDRGRLCYEIQSLFPEYSTSKYVKTGIWNLNDLPEDVSQGSVSPNCCKPATPTNDDEGGVCRPLANRRGMEVGLKEM